LRDELAERELSLAINEVETACDISIAMDASKDYGLAGREADDVLNQVRTAVAQWRGEAGKLGIPRSEQELMAPAFQTELFAPEEPPSTLFFALFPDAPTRAKIASLAQDQRLKHGLRGRLLAPTRLHISLYGVGVYPRVPPGILSSACDAAASIVAAPVEMVLDCAMSFAGSDAFVLRESEDTALKDLLHAIGATMRKAGLGQGFVPSYVPHLTLLYDKHLVQKQAIDPIRWTAREFVLVESLVGQSKYVIHGRWPLRD
jgi:2'-5' RNA ligase